MSKWVDNKESASERFAMIAEDEGWTKDTTPASNDMQATTPTFAEPGYLTRERAVTRSLVAHLVEIGWLDETHPWVKT